MAIGNDSAIFVLLPQDGYAAVGWKAPGEGKEIRHCSLGMLGSRLFMGLQEMKKYLKSYLEKDKDSGG